MNWKSFPRPLSLLAMALGAALAPLSSVVASPFTETAVDQKDVIAVARPYGIETTKYDLLVIEQIPGKNQCWQVTDGNPTLVDPLLLNFDFTGHCRRATDSNGYSLRIDGQDYGLDYLLRLVPRGNELVLVATSRNGRGQELVIGGTGGISAGFMEVKLNPGWQFTKRTFEDKILGHYYISGTQAAITGGSTRPAVVDAVSPEEMQGAQEIVIPAEEQAVDGGSTVIKTETEIIIQQNDSPGDQSSGIVEEESVTVTETSEDKTETTTAQELGTVTPQRPPVVTPPRRRTPTPADFRR